ncbi:GGDEF domain-containing protein [Dokdonella sp. MW10]|uniref:GGDEF domain-containing protein n=1 Tax=Dokdonella sp. MW10 TaxID=2992926 RepID=UPI003F7CF1EB
MHLDIPTAMSLAATLALLVGLGVAYAARGYPAEVAGPVRAWVHGLLLQPLPYVLFALRGEIHDLFSIVFANALLVATFAFQMHALRLFNGRPARVPLFAGLVVATLVGEALLTWFWPSLALRIVLVSLVIILLVGFGLSALRRRHGVRTRAEQLLGGIFVVGAGLLAARVVVQPAAVGFDGAPAATLQGIVFTYAALMPVVATSAFMLMVGDRLARDVTRLATRDPLTGVYNRHTLAELANRAYVDAVRRGRPLSIVSLDIDHFKRINDEFGHEAGDAALCRFAGIVAENLRGDDILARMGGEEFVALLPDTDEAAARTLAEMLRQRIADSGFEISGWPVPLRASIGVGTLDASAPGVGDLLRATDVALHTAKRAGRNRVVAASQLDSHACEMPAALAAMS